MKLVFVGILILFSSACDSELSIMGPGTARPVATDSAKIFALNHLSAKPGDLIKVSGDSLYRGMTLQFGGKSVPLFVESQNSAMFIMPESSATGNFGAVFYSGSGQPIASLALKDESEALEIPTIEADADQVCSDIIFQDARGHLKTGTRLCVSSYATCVADGEKNCLTHANFPAVEKIGLLQKMQDLRSVSTLAGINGTLENCASDGEANCVAVGPTFAAIEVDEAASKLILNQSLGGITGSFVLPLPSHVLSSTGFGANGTALVGTFTLPPPNQVESGSPPYGDPSAPTTPSLVADFPDPANVRTNDSTHNVTGTFPNCSATHQADCWVEAPYSTIDLTTAGAATGLTSANFNTTLHSSGNFEFWNAAGVRQTVAGNTNLIAAKIKSGIEVFGVTGAYPSATNRLSTNTATADLTSFTSQITSNGSFEFFDSAGAVYTGSGDSDLIASNLRAGIALENLSLSGILPASPLPAPSSLSSQYFTNPDRVLLQWPSAAGAAGYLVVARAGAPANFTADNMTTYTSGDTQGSNTVVYAGAGLFAAHTGIAAGSNLFYAVYSYDVNTFYSTDKATTSNAATSMCAGLTGGVWTTVPGSAVYGTSDFCLMTYEARITPQSRVESRAADSPIANIGREPARSRCQALGAGYDLISNPEWMTVGTNIASVAANWSTGTLGSGFLSMGHTDNSPGNACASSTDPNLAFVQSDCIPKDSTGMVWAQKRTQTLSNGEILWDFAGNVWEWTTRDVSNISAGPFVASDGGPTYSWREFSALNSGFSLLTKSELVPIQSQTSFWNDTWNASHNIGQYRSGTSGYMTMLRGGSYGDTTAGGIFVTRLDYDQRAQLPFIGFRCVYHATP